ncbi:hypothetical protein CAE01nite_08930 [Cellulomonas aerilata]|uniref:Uncharacterized protein n=1 Tax=Cellulomonas aerilata TaxID=515326 RepID=A0A512D9L0_9CELL|nr:hypothetical protein CAE01nite_08930 [Cellulomonas aerilata]
MVARRCRVGRHAWQERVVTDAGGPKRLYRRCTRCGAERTRFLAPAPGTGPDPADRTTPGVPTW